MRVETYRRIRMDREKRIACIAHDNKKAELIDWLRFNRGSLEEHVLYATRTTGALIIRELELPVTTFHSGPLGGDLEIGARIARGSIDFLIFFWDPLEPQPETPCHLGQDLRFPLGQGLRFPLGQGLRLRPAQPGRPLGGQCWVG